MRGWVRVFSYTRPQQNLIQYQPWRVSDGEDEQDYELEEARPHQKALIAKLRGIDDRDQALALCGRDILIDPAQFPALPPGEYYHHQLLGLQAVDQHGAVLGEVSEILESPAHDVLLVRGYAEYLIPYLPDDTVRSVSLESGRIEVRWDGVLE